MLPVLLTVCCIFFGSSLSEMREESLCYGENLSISGDLAAPLFNEYLYLTPSDGTPRKLLMAKGESKDPRLKISHGLIYFTDVTVRDSGVFSVAHNQYMPSLKIIRLQVSDCADLIEKYYGYSYDVDIPRTAEFLEFTAQLHPDQPKILWNRTNPQIHEGGRGKVKNGVFEMHDLTQADSGHYNVRSNDHTILTRQLVTVRENTKLYREQVQQSVLISYPWVVRTWTVTFTPVGGDDPQTVIKAGRLFFNNNWFTGRIQTSNSGIEIEPLEEDDSGFFEFRDQEGYLALKAELRVIQDISAIIYAVGFGLIVLGLAVCGCCCCCCCNKKCCKKDKSSILAVPSAVYYHVGNQPQGPTYSAAPLASVDTSHVARDPARASSLQVPLYPPLNVHGNPSEPEVPPSRGSGFTLAPSAGTDFLSSESVPRFELKGTMFPSALPLSSNTTTTDVYSSDKLNLL